MMARKTGISILIPLSCCILVAVIFTAGCGSARKSVALARAGVVQFHQRLDAGQFEEIYADTAPEFRKITTHDDFVALLSAVHRKLGNVQDATGTGWNVNWIPSGWQITLQYQTKFDKDKADEIFTWRVTDGKALLFGYRINSLALVTQ